MTYPGGETLDEKMLRVMREQAATNRFAAHYLATHAPLDESSEEIGQLTEEIAQFQYPSWTVEKDEKLKRAVKANGIKFSERTE